MGKQVSQAAKLLAHETGLQTKMASSNCRDQQTCTLLVRLARTVGTLGDRPGDRQTHKRKGRERERVGKSSTELQWQLERADKTETVAARLMDTNCVTAEESTDILFVSR